MLRCQHQKCRSSQGWGQRAPPSLQRLTPSVRLCTHTHTHTHTHTQAPPCYMWPAHSMARPLLMSRRAGVCVGRSACEREEHTSCAHACTNRHASRVLHVRTHARIGAHIHALTARAYCAKPPPLASGACPHHIPCACNPSRSRRRRCGGLRPAAAASAAATTTAGLPAADKATCCIKTTCPWCRWSSSWWGSRAHNAPCVVWVLCG